MSDKPYVEKTGGRYIHDLQTGKTKKADDQVSPNPVAEEPQKPSGRKAADDAAKKGK